MSSLKQIESAKKNLDKGAAVNTLPLIVGPDGAGDRIFYRTASGVNVFQTVERGSFKVTMKRFVPISERKTHWCTHGVVHCW